MKAPRWLAVAAVAAAAAVGLAGCSSSTPSSSGGSLNFVEDKGWNYKPLSAEAKTDVHASLKTTSYTDQDAYQALIKHFFIYS